MLEKSSKRDIEDISVVKEEYGKLMEVHSNLEAKLSSLSTDKQSVEERFKVLYDEHENMKARYSYIK